MCGASGAFWEMSESVWNQRRSGECSSYQRALWAVLWTLSSVPHLLPASPPGPLVLWLLPSLWVTALLQAGWSRAEKRMEGTIEHSHCLLSLEIVSLLE